MYSIKINIIYFVSINIIVQIQSLVQLPIVEDNNIAIAETVIRNTVNSLFATLNIQDIKKRPAIKQYSTIHNLFASITLTDCENHKKIARLSRVNNIDNSTQYFITQINEVLNEGDKSKEANVNDNNIYVTTYIERFIKKLRYLKGVYLSKNDTRINENVLKFLENNKKTFINYTGHNFSNKTIKGSENKNVLDDIGVWQSSGRRIFNGIRTNIKRFPFMASIHFFSRFQCAGSIIKNDLVITSASCMQIAWNNRFFRENPSFLFIRVGSDMYQKGGDNVPVLEIYFHPQYDPDTLSHNLAMLRLGRLLKFRRKAKRIKKINVDKNPVPLSLNTFITVVGWGAQDSSNKIYDVYRNKLAYATLDFYPLKLCQEHYSDTYVTNRNFCAGFFSKGGGACSHDAGGPGVIGSILTGVISFGSPHCGAMDSPTVFTKLGFYTDWIESIMEQKVRGLNKRTTTLATTRSTRWFDLLAQAPRTTRLSIRPFNVGERSEEENILRMANDDRFKEFLSTVFSSEEVNVNLDKNKESEINSPVLRLDKLQSGMTATIIADQELPTDTTPKSNDQSSSGSEELIEPPKNFLKVEPPVKVVIENQIVSAKRESNVNLTSKVKSAKITVAKSLEEDIMHLINNLEIDNLLSSASLDKKEGIEQNNNESQKEESVSKEKELISSGIIPLDGVDSEDNVVSEKTAVDGGNNEDNIVSEKTALDIGDNDDNVESEKTALDIGGNDDNVESEKTALDIDDNDDNVETEKTALDGGDNYDNVVTEKAALRYLLKSDNSEENEGGMSIPAEEFQDLTFRESTDISDTDNEVVLSESALLDLISIAIKKEGYEKIKEKKFLL